MLIYLCWKISQENVYLTRVSKNTVNGNIYVDKRNNILISGDIYKDTHILGSQKNDNKLLNIANIKNIFNSIIFCNCLQIYYFKHI